MLEDDLTKAGTLEKLVDRHSLTERLHEVENVNCGDNARQCSSASLLLFISETKRERAVGELVFLSKTTIAFAALKISEPRSDERARVGELVYVRNLLFPQDACKAMLYSSTFLLRLQEVATPLGK